MTRRALLLMLGVVAGACRGPGAAEQARPIPDSAEVVLIVDGMV